MYEINEKKLKQKCHTQWRKPSINYAIMYTPYADDIFKTFFTLCWSIIFMSIIHLFSKTSKPSDLIVSGIFSSVLGSPHLSHRGLYGCIYSGMYNDVPMDFAHALWKENVVYECSIA